MQNVNNDAKLVFIIILSISQINKEYITNFLVISKND